MTQDEINDLVKYHERLLKGNGSMGIMKRVETLWDWFQNSRGKNSTIMFIKDVLLAGGLLLFFVEMLVTKL